ncbi:MAG TPA: PIN domain-containing protein [Candidatus Dormibacteraeota bacterium]
MLIQDSHTEAAATEVRRRVTHLLSTLGYAEVIAVLARLERDRELPRALADAARQTVRGGPWRGLALQPDRSTMDELAAGWPLRGADLWHLATAWTLRRELPELQLITFDSRLRAAAEGLKLSL